MGLSVEKEHGWTLTTIVAEADGSVVLRVTPTREAVRLDSRKMAPGQGLLPHE
jgi:hypothetical protein